MQDDIRPGQVVFEGFKRHQVSVDIAEDQDIHSPATASIDARISYCGL